MSQNIIQSVFDRMESIGWTLDNFKEAYKAHKAFLSNVLEKFNNDEINEDELVWCAQFVNDFLDCLEALNNVQNQNSKYRTKKEKIS